MKANSRSADGGDESKPFRVFAQKPSMIHLPGGGSSKGVEKARRVRLFVPKEGGQLALYSEVRSTVSTTKNTPPPLLLLCPIVEHTKLISSSRLLSSGFAVLDGSTGRLPASSGRSRNSSLDRYLERRPILVSSPSHPPHQPSNLSRLPHFRSFTKPSSLLSTSSFPIISLLRWSRTRTRRCPRTTQLLLLPPPHQLLAEIPEILSRTTIDVVSSLRTRIRTLLPPHATSLLSFLVSRIRRRVLLLSNPRAPLPSLPELGNLSNLASPPPIFHHPPHPHHSPSNFLLLFVHHHHLSNLASRPRTLLPNSNQALPPNLRSSLRLLLLHPPRFLLSFLNQSGRRLSTLHVRRDSVGPDSRESKRNGGEDAGQDECQ